MNAHQRNQELETLPSLDNQEVTVAVVSYNGRNVIKLCLESIFAQTYKPFRVFLINNDSTDGTPEWVKQNYPKVEVLDCPQNRGPNPARNLAIKRSPNRLILLVDDDAVLAKNCLSELMKASHIYPEGAVWIPRIVYYKRQDIIQFDGTSLHFIGEAILLNGEKRLSHGVKDIIPTDIAGGVTYLVSKSSAISIGLYDEDYFFGRTDTEFGFRLTLSGYKIYTVPEAICYHRVKSRGLSMAFYQARNRWYLILTTYSWRTLILLTPALMVYEISLILFLLIKRNIKEYMRARREVLFNLPIILRKRKSIQALKTVSDRDVLHCGPINIRADLIENRYVALGKSLMDKFFAFYWKLVYPIV